VKVEAANNKSALSGYKWFFIAISPRSTATNHQVGLTKYCQMLASIN